MSLKENTFKIMIRVQHQSKTYEEKRHDVKHGCNHIDNIPSVARYMAQKIFEDIKEE